MNENLIPDGNGRNIAGAVTDDTNQYIRRLRIDDATKGLKVMIVGGTGSGTVTSITQGTGILLTPSPITTTGSVALATAIQPIATLGTANQSIRVNAGATALEYYTPSVGSGTVTSVSVVTANGVSGSVATATTTPAITLTLGAITPSSVTTSTITGLSSFSPLNISSAGNGNTLNLDSANATSPGSSGGVISIQSGQGNTSGDGGEIDIVTGDGGTTGNGGIITILAGDGGGGDTNGGNIRIQPGVKSGSGVDGVVSFRNPSSGASAVLNLASIITSDKTFTLPNSSGTLTVLGNSTTGSGNIVLATSPSLTSPIVSGSAGTTAGEQGYDATNKALLIGDGTAIQSLFTSGWKSWTPTWAGLTIGNASVTAKYAQVGKIVFYKMNVIFGNTSSWSAEFTFTLPVTSTTDYGWQTGTASFFDSSSGNVNVGIAGFASSTTNNFRFYNIVSTQLLQSTVNNTAPYTWAVSDQVNVEGFYEAA